MKRFHAILRSAGQLAPLGALFAIVSVTLPARVAFADGLTVPPKVSELGKGGDALIKAGYLDATLYGADPSGANDSTAAIQAAVDDAMKYAMTTYLPSGTYKISGAISGMQAWNLQHCGTVTDIGTPNSFVQAPTLVGPASGARPLLKLVNHADGFGDENNPKAVVHFWNYDPGCTDKGCSGWMGESDCLFDGVVRDIDLQLGDNPGAVGVQFASAQYSYMENVSVDATGAYAGIQGIPTTEVVVNLSVTGGQYGIIPATGFGSLVGITLKNQVVAGLVIDGYAATAVTGFDIVEEIGAIPISNKFFNYQGSSDALTDGRIVMKGGTEAAISNPNGHDLYIKNVYISSTSGKLVQSGTDSSIAGSADGKTDVIEEYSYTNRTPITQTGVTTTSYNIIDGVKGQNTIQTVKLGSSTPPSDLLTRHLPGALPWFADHGVKDVTEEGAVGDGKTDATLAIQKAIDESDYVFLPRGDYAISSTLKLRPETHLFGVPGPLSRLFAPDWDPQGKTVPYIETADTETGKTYVGDLFITLSNGTDRSTLGGIDWRAGRSSVMRQVAVYLPWDSTGPWDSKPRTLMHAVGSGGGKWYGPQLMQTGHSTLAGDDVFGLLVDGTTAPLTIYGVNPEHEQSGPFLEVRGAKNVRFFGLKSESLSYVINKSDNVMFAGKTANGDDQPSMQVEDSTNVIVPIFHEYGGQGKSTSTIVSEVKDGTTIASIAGNDRCSLFKRGNFDDTPFPKCGDGVCDGTESAKDCPEDCTATTGDGGHDGAGGGSGTGHPSGAGGANGAGGGSNSDQPGNGASAGGCGCRVDATESSTSGGALSLVMLGLVGLRRRRIPRSRGAC